MVHVRFYQVVFESILSNSFFEQPNLLLGPEVLFMRSKKTKSAHLFGLDKLLLLAMNFFWLYLGDCSGDKHALWDTIWQGLNRFMLFGTFINCWLYISELELLLCVL